MLDLPRIVDSPHVFDIGDEVQLRILVGIVVEVLPGVQCNVRV